MRQAQLYTVEDMEAYVAGFDEFNRKRKVCYRVLRAVKAMLEDARHKSLIRLLIGYQIYVEPFELWLGASSVSESVDLMMRRAEGPRSNWLNLKEFVETLDVGFVSELYKALPELVSSIVLHFDLDGMPIVWEHLDFFMSQAPERAEREEG